MAKESGNELSPTNNCRPMTKSRNKPKKITLYVPPMQPPLEKTKGD